MIAGVLGNKTIAWIRRAARNSHSNSLSALATYIDRKQDQIRLKNNGFKPNLTMLAASYLEQLNKNGICVVENFWDESKCEQAVEDIDRFIKENPEYLHPTAKADKRIYGANNISDQIDEFNRDPLLAQIASAYNNEFTQAAFTLGAYLPATHGNLGSGEGWHRDAPTKQFKAIIYISDVELDNGPFQIIRNSHTLNNMIADTWTGRLSYPQYRITQQEVDRITNRNPERLDTYTARAGTVILVDTSAIHRGMPIRSGSRYALTNYYFPEDRIDKGLFEKFKVVPKKH